MKKQILSTGLGLILTLGLLLPLNHSLVNVNDQSVTKVNVNGGCIKVFDRGLKVNLCDEDNGTLKQLDVSWNSGGG